MRVVKTMSATIEYKVGNETHRITRDDYHMDIDRYLTAYNIKEENNGVTRMVKIPDSRVVMIYEDEK